MGKSLRRAPRKKEETEINERERPTPGRLPAFIRGCLMGGMVKLELRHVTEQGSARVDKWPLRTTDGEDHNAEALLFEILSVAESDAAGWGGYQRYALCAYDAEDTAAYSKRAMFDIKSDGDAGEDEGPSEGATTHGQRAQEMRHREVEFRTFTTAMRDVLELQQSLIKSTTERLRMVEEQKAGEEKRRLEIFTTFEELMSMRHERQLETAKEERYDRLQTKLTNELMGYLPVVAKRFLGAGSGPNKPIEAEEGLSRLLGTFDGNQIKALGQLFQPHQVALFGELMNAYGPSPKGKKPPTYIGEELVHKLLDSLEPSQQERIMQLLRPDQLQGLSELANAYGKREETKEREAAAQ
jgi:hypothetical protein